MHSKREGEIKREGEAACISMCWGVHIERNAVIFKMNTTTSSAHDFMEILGLSIH